MPFIPIPNVAQVGMRFTQDNQEVANVYHVAFAGPADAPLLNQIGNRFILWWTSELRPLVSSTVTLREVSVVDQSVENGVGVVTADTLPLAGLNGNNAMPNGTTIAVKWSTGRTGRSYRGRTFHIGLTESQVTANAIENAFAATLRGVYAALVLDLKGDLTPLVVASRYSNNAPRTTGISTEVLAATINPIIDSQRRRLPGRGR